MLNYAGWSWRFQCHSNYGSGYFQLVALSGSKYIVILPYQSEVPSAQLYKDSLKRFWVLHPSLKVWMLDEYFLLTKYFFAFVSFLPKKKGKKGYVEHGKNPKTNEATSPHLRLGYQAKQKNKVAFSVRVSCCKLEKQRTQTVEIIFFWRGILSDLCWGRLS